LEVGMASDSQGRDPTSASAKDQVEATASRMVGELLDRADCKQLLSAKPESDSEFADRLVDCELALIAFGEEPLRIALDVAVLTIARDSVRTYAEIHALPEQEAAGRP
jgi:hypothetical protein